MFRSDLLKDKVALVTGGSRGIGRRICEVYASLGAHVIVNYASRHESAEQVVRVIESEGRRGLAWRADVSRSEQVAVMFGRVLDEFGRLDILVNNAGVQVWMPITEMTEEIWNHTLDVDLKGTFLCSKLAAEQMIRQGWGGRILNITSVQAEQVVPTHVNYAAAKGGQAQLTRALAVELARHKITVNAIGPGAIDTDMNQRLRDDPDQRARVIARIPLGRLGTVDDCAWLAAFLASDLADYITGQNIYVDGGIMLL